MHIHGNHMNVNAANFYSVGNGERSAAAQRAADVRKKLLKGAQSIDAAADPEENLLIGHWLDSANQQSQSEDEYRTADTGKDSDFA